MVFKSSDGGSTILVILLMLMVVSIGAFGFIIFVAKWDQRVANVSDDTVNLTGISYASETYNATNETIHGLSNIMPGFIYFILIFLAVAFITLLAIALKHR